MKATILEILMCFDQKQSVSGAGLNFFTSYFNDALICSCQEFIKKKFIVRKYGNKCVGNAITMRKVSYKLRGNFTQW